MIRYYAARVHDSVDGQRDTVMVQETHPDYGAAMNVHVRRSMREAASTLSADGTPRRAHWRDTVLLDLGTIENLDGWALRRLLDLDPVLRAIFELGRRAEALDASNRRDARVENPS